MSVLVNEFTSRLKSARKAKDLTQREVAAELEISQAYYWQIENGQVSPTEDLLRGISKLFDDEFFKSGLRNTTRQVWKFPVAIDDHQIIPMPQGAELLHFANQAANQGLAVWALVDPAQPVEDRRFRLAGTGHPIEEQVRFVGTALLNGTILVFHLFEEV